MQKNPFIMRITFKALVPALVGVLALTSCDGGGSGRQDSELYASFVNPPQQARPRVWWHWMNGNITKDGIRKDLLWMNRVGIGGFHHFDAGMVVPQVVDQRLIYMDDGWKDAFRYATALADSLGMEMAVASAPGWSSTGGPWVTPEDAMKKLTWRETVVEGGTSLSLPLPAPYETTGFFLNVPPADNVTTFSSSEVADHFYKDIAVLAVKLTGDDRALGGRVSSSGGRFTEEMLTDGDLNASGFLPRNDALGYGWIAYTFDRPTTVRALSVADGAIRTEWGCMEAPVSKHLEASDDGQTWRRICDIPHGAAARQTVSVPATTARHFRMVWDNPVEDNPYTSNKGERKPGTQVAEFILYTATKINHAEEKAGFATPQDMMVHSTLDEGSALPALTDVVDLTDKVDANGQLTWDAPEGTWRIYRFGYSLTGKKNHPAPPEATGLEVDKLDADAVRRYINTYLDMYHDAAGGLMGEHGLQYLLIDSYEAGWETWTPRMAEEFEARRGYSPMPWLPVLTGQVVDSAERSEQFLWDWRKTIGELIADNLYAEVERVAAERGLRCYYESHENGRLYLVDGMDAKKKAAIPMAAHWAAENAGGADFTMAECDIRESASVAHVYGQNLVACESFTSNGLENRAYTFYPGNLKSVADHAMASGVNRFVIHESAHQPVDDKRPGLGLLIFGQWFNRHETWAEQAKAWTDYLARSSFMLQQGRYVADILYYYGEDNCITGLFSHSTPQIPAGYSFDYASADVILTQASARNGRIVTPGGMSYGVLVLDKNARSMSLPVLKKLAELSKAGVTIIGEKPSYEPSLLGDKAEFARLADEVWAAKNVIDAQWTMDNGACTLTTAGGQTLGQALAGLGIAPDLTADDMSDLAFVHRKVGNNEVYWVSNATDQDRHVKATFRVSGLEPEIWHPETGEREAAAYHIYNGVTEVELDLVSHDAVFVVFSGKAAQAELTLPEVTEILFRHLDTPWQVTFGEGKTLTFPHLTSYTESTDPDIKYFSGTTTYRNTFLVSEPELKQGRLRMKLGRVGCIAQVTVNGQALGTLWKAPYDIDITAAVQPGENQVEVSVTNLWVNRIIGDQQPGCRQRVTYPAFDFYTAQSPLLPSGLMGPVDIFIEQESRQPYDRVYTGQIWLDTNGKPIHAHGFQVMEQDGVYYWYGENKEFTVLGSPIWTYGIRCYRSTDFYNWEDCGLIIEPDTVNPLSPMHYTQNLDRPHIIHCDKTGKYVCWIKSMDEDGYFVILQADDILGPYTYVRSLKPQGYGVGDFDLYADPETGKGYVWFERPHWELICSTLSDDYTDVVPGEYSSHFVGQRPPFTREAPTHFVHNGKHYLLSSGTTGYYPNLSEVASFDDYHGEYTVLGNPTPTDPYNHSFCAQYTDVVRIPGKKDLYIAVADRWMPQLANTDEPQREAERMIPKYANHKPFEPDFSTPRTKDKRDQVRTGWDVTYNAVYVFLPIVFRDGMPQMEWKDEWRLEDYE